MKHQFYEPVRCANKECAFPTVTCDECRCNVSLFNSAALVFKGPKGNYRFVRDFQQINKRNNEY